MGVFATSIYCVAALVVLTQIAGTKGSNSTSTFTESSTNSSVNGSEKEPCNRREENCLKELTPHLLSTITWEMMINGDFDLGMENLNPIHHDLVQLNQSRLQYNFTDTYTDGLVNCNFVPGLFKPNGDEIAFHSDFRCPNFTTTGQYEINGTLISKPIEGKGNFTIKTNEYNISVEAVHKISAGEDSKPYMTVLDFKLVATPLGSVNFTFNNLFNGQEDKANLMLKFMEENSRSVAIELMEPLFTAHFLKIAKNVNILLNQNPLDNKVKL